MESIAVRVAYLVNQYPKVSHSFIRREILALERQGIKVLRIAIRGWDEAAVDPADRVEQERTRYVLGQGIGGLLGAMLVCLLSSPRRFMGALVLAIGMSRQGDRSLVHHLAYLGEACRMLPWLREFGAQHLHAHFGTNSTTVAMLARALGGPPYSFTVHGPEEFDKPLAIGLGEKIRRSAFVVAVSSYGRSQLFRWVEHAHWSKVKVVHCGIDAEFHRFDPVPPPLAPRIVCVGRLCEQKGQLLLVEACSRLRGRGCDFELVLAGDGEMRQEIESFIARLGLGTQVRITGWIGGDQVRAEILAARALVLASFAEGLPVVLMEAMALRRPVLSTYVAGIPELVRPGENGWLVPPGSVDDLADALADLLRQPADEIQRRGEAAYRRVLARHSVDAEAGRLRALFRGAEVVAGDVTQRDKLPLETG